MARTILIARPHTFIVSVMKPFLEEAGFATRKLEHLSELPTAAVGIAGAVISLALSSPIAESADEVFLQLRQSAPRAAVLFAAMLTFDQARPALERIAKQIGIQAHILGVTTVSDASNAWLGRPETFLYLSKEDLTAPDQRSVAARLMRRHFA